MKYWNHETWSSINWQKNEEIIWAICFGIVEYVENTGHISFSEVSHQLSRLNITKILLDKSNFSIIEKPTRSQTNIMLRLGIPLPGQVLDIRAVKLYNTERNNIDKDRSDFEK